MVIESIKTDRIHVAGAKAMRQGATNHAVASVRGPDAEEYQEEVLSDQLLRGVEAEV